MRRFLSYLLLVILACFFLSCDAYTKRKESLNYEDFEKFYYNGNLYILPENYSDIGGKYTFYGEKHKVGYTIGVYNRAFETYVLDIDVEENILFTDHIYFWFKEGYEFPDIYELNVTKLLFSKIGEDSVYTVDERLYLLENITINDLFIEYIVDKNNDSYLLDEKNFLRYEMRYIYENGVLMNHHFDVAIYNNRVFVEKYDEDNRRKLYVSNEEYSNILCELLLDMN